ncbi:amino acid adenylation domain-containing protein [Paenibacillus illinoisensis]|uniref:amino acid adenylation domain-containing protein n=1 Tax=Paenibacillus illinoisensis TaxID=59845 RepID=UPI003015BC42
MEELHRLTPQLQHRWKIQSGNDSEITLLLKGHVNKKKLKKALEKLIERHDALRSKDAKVEGLKYPLKVFEENAELICIDDVSVPELENGIRVQDCEASTNSIMAKLTQVSEIETRLTLIFPSNVIDYWSSNVIIQELCRYYVEDTPRVEEEIIQFSEFLDWQNNLFEEDEVYQGKEFWREQIKEFKNLEISQNNPNEHENILKPIKLKTTLPNKSLSMIMDISKKRNINVEAVLFSSWQALIWRNRQQEEKVLCGVELNCRDFEELTGTIGPLSRAVPILGQIDKMSTFDSLLSRTDHMLKQAQLWQEYFVWDLFDEVCPEFKAEHLPLCFEYYKLDAQKLSSDIELTVEDINIVNELHDLKLICAHYPDYLQIELVSKRNQRELSKIQRMLDQYLTLLEAMLSSPDENISSLPIVGSSEKSLILNDWNTNTVDYDTGILIHEVFEEQALADPSATAIVSNDCAMTYDDLNKHANSLARHLRRIGIGPETCVGLLVDRSPEMIVGMMAILKAGGAYVPLDKSLPKERISLLSRECKLNLILTDNPKINDDLSCDVISLKDEALYKFSCDNLERINNANSLAYVIFTSGSTGKPKAVGVEHKQLLNYTNSIIDMLGIDQKLKFATVSSVSADLGNTSIFPALMTGGMFYTLSKDTLIDPQLFSEFIQKHSIDCLKTTPSHFAAMLSSPYSDRVMPTKFLILGGELSSCSLVRDIRNINADCKIINHYGPTETCVGVTIYDVPEDLNLEKLDTSLPIGKPLPNNKLYLLDEYFNPVPIGTPGELFIGGPQISRGYLNQPDMTAEKFIPDPFSKVPGDRLYCTGDMAVANENGTYHFLRRIDNQLKIRGYRIEPEEIEAFLIEHPAVLRAAVTIMNNKSGSPELVAYIIPRPEYFENYNMDLENEQVSDWVNVFDNVYSQIEYETDASNELFATTGWNSSYTGKPISQEEINESVQGIISRIQSLNTNRVLEIGCGTGLLLSKIAPESQQYWATDFSQPVLTYIEKTIQERDLSLPQLKLLQREATNFEGIPEQEIDLIILNSVVQYFPSVSYLTNVLSGAVKVLHEKGSIFIGDIINHKLIEVFHSSVERYRARPDLKISQLKEKVRSAVERENELMFDPEFFESLPNLLSNIGDVEIQLKRGRSFNELAKFRYDVILNLIENVNSPREEKVLEWSNLKDISEVKRKWEENSFDVLRVIGVPDLRVWEDIKAFEMMNESDEDLTVKELNECIRSMENKGIHPEDWWELSTLLDCEIKLNYSSRIGQYDVTFYSPISKSTNESLTTNVSYKEGESINDLANDPIERKLANKLTARLKKYLADNLADYMIPSYLFIIDQFPIKENGKIDFNQLSQYSKILDEQTNFVAPESPIEQVIAEIWSETLNLNAISVTANFFDIGGHSLVAAQVAYKINETFNIKFPLRSMFENTTIQEVALVVAQSLLEGLDHEEVNELSEEINNY